ncbi:MAG: O-antigen ligase family protein [Thermomicrobiales bacterium]
MALSAPRSTGWFERTALLRGPALPLVAALALGVVGGVAVAALGLLLPLILLIGVVGAALVLLDARWGLLGALGVILLLPFGTFPVKVGLTPTLLEGALGLTWLVFALRIMLRRDARLLPTRLDGPLCLFLIVTVFAFVLGLDSGYTTQTLHDYAKMVTSISIFFLIVNLVRTRRDLALALGWIGLGGAVAALLGLGLWAMGPAAANVLVKLARLGYPTSRIIRYVEDDPTKPIRATGTGVDPNSFAGLLMVVLVLLIAQAAARRPLVPRVLAMAAVPPVGLCLLLTQSRAAWVGAAAGIALLALVRYRWLLAPLALGAVAVAALGIGRGFVQRFILGIQLKDPATKLRLAEYRNALAIIRNHPLFGVGFGAAPSIDQQTGVSSIYLTLAERSGLLGLALFLVVIVVLAVTLWPAVLGRQAHAHAESEAALALAAALAAALVAGALDHSFVNILFPHMVALFWLLAALAVVAARLTSQAIRQDGPRRDRKPERAALTFDF